jgi:Kdo2-lipid IVA lauroyltransferase/acyltransferase
MTTWQQWRRRARRAVKRAINKVAGWGVALLLGVIRRCDRVHISDFGGAFMRTVGPWLPEHRLGRANLAAAFPEKSAAEIEKILRGVWDNLGRVGAEIAHLDDICVGEGYQRPNLDFTQGDIDRFDRVRDDGKPALVFAAHLANWELPAVIAAIGSLDAVVLYRRPNLVAVADAVIRLRSGLMGELLPANLGAPVGLLHALEEGRHVAMLVDQHYTKGVEVKFFGRKCRVNPLLAILARYVECPIHGTRVVRLPGHRFAAELSEEVPPVRDADGRVDIAGTMQAITDVVERWVREHPEQWLWVHRRWR